ncbi:hypothetical protein [Flammeovirga sp. SJP92]|uniref:hypothetical protein n=1 Tax=Flammeovirga sp. SJP92 TaxID=1775430 RepID=UPI0007875255|nr:hypothetical protein [Flammeovirga sp. SJP92]KXX69918.1 hypothetical protein AVL50_13640 [Flammeovirga sp. SJP92]
MSNTQKEKLQKKEEMAIQKSLRQCKHKLMQAQLILIIIGSYLLFGVIIGFAGGEYLLAGISAIISILYFTLAFYVSKAPEYAIIIGLVTYVFMELISFFGSDESLSSFDFVRIPIFIYVLVVAYHASKEMFEIKEKLKLIDAYNQEYTTEEAL